MRFVLILASFLFAQWCFADQNQPNQSLAETAVQSALALHLSEQKEWLNLVRYQKNWLGGYTSDASSPDFFVAPHGKTDPQAEMTADIRGFFSPTERVLSLQGGPRQSVRCQFPARWSYIAHHLHLSDRDLPARECPYYEKFKSDLGANSLTLVFSSYYVNNPSSAFGHTFLRFNHYAHGSHSGSELIDTGVGFAANPENTGALEYALKGFFGGFIGVFSDVRYYVKVHDYNDSESRDLWEYDLGLSELEITHVVDHLWELGSAAFPYYYLSKNCSYYLVALLEDSVPRLRLLSRLPTYVIPVDTIRAMSDEPKLVTSVEFRASIRSQFLARYALLNATEREEFSRLSKSRQFAIEDIGGLAPNSQARVLDTLLDQIDLNFDKELSDTTSAVHHWKQNILRARTHLPVDASDESRYEAQIHQSTQPDFGHRSRRFMVGAGSHNRSRFASFDFRFALHDLVDPPEGYPSLATIEFGHFNFQFAPDRHNFYLNSFHLIDITSLVPISKLSLLPSFRFNIGADRVYDHRCRGCTAAIIDGAVGAAATPIDFVTVYSLIGPTLAASSGFQKRSLNAEFKTALGVRFILSRRWLMDAESIWSWDAFSRNIYGNSTRLQTRWVPDKINGVDLQLQRYEDRSTAGIMSYVRYF